MVILVIFCQRLAPQQGDGDFADLLPAVGAVDLGGFVHLLVQAGDGGKVDDGVPAHRLPQIEQGLGDPDVVVGGQDVDGGLKAHIVDH